MEVIIIPAEEKDLQTIYQLFEEAIQFQKANNYIGWSRYDKEFIKSDVRGGLLFKVVERRGIIGIFSICYTDKLIWRSLEMNDALYLHRIVLNRKFQGAKIFDTILSWSRVFAQYNERRFIRMDTWAKNFKLINYYKGYGFRFVENYTTEDTTDLPVQHRNLNVALLEFEV